MPRKKAVARGRGAQGGGTIRQRKDGTWEARYTVGRDPATGKQVQRSIYAKTEAEARKKLTAVTSDLDEGLYAEPSKTTVEQWMNHWVETYTINVKDTTLRSYQDAIRLHINPGIGKVRLDKLTTDVVQKFYNDLLRSGRHMLKGQKKEAPKGLSAKTVRNIHVVLHKALKQSPLKHNPADSCVLPLMEKPKLKVLEEDALGVFMREVEQHNLRALFTTILLCGLRRGEAVGLRLKNIQWYEYIDVVEQAQRERILGGGGKIRLVPLKNNRSRRVYPATVVFDVLAAHVAELETLRTKAGDAWVENDLVFPNDTGGFRDADAVYQNYKRFLKRIGLDTDLRVHDLRHTYATNSYAEGVDVRTLAETLGHQDPGFTLRTYGQSTDTMKKDAADKMGERVVKVRMKHRQKIRMEKANLKKGDKV